MRAAEVETEYLKGKIRETKFIGRKLVAKS